MSLTAGGDKIVMIEYARGAVHVDTFQTKKELVFRIIARGDIADSPDYFGGPKHLAALDEIVQEIENLRTQIAKDEELPQEQED